MDPRCALHAELQDLHRVVASVAASKFHPPDARIQVFPPHAQLARRIVRSQDAPRRRRFALPVLPRPPGLVRVPRLVALAAASVLVHPFAAAAQERAPTAPVPRVDSVRVDTLHRPTPDSTRRVTLPRPTVAPDTGKPPSIFGPHADLGLDVHARIEAKGEQSRNER